MAMSRTIDEIRGLKVAMDKKLSVAISGIVAEFEWESGVKVDSVHAVFQMVREPGEEEKYEKVACVTSSLDWGV